MIEAKVHQRENLSFPFLAEDKQMGEIWLVTAVSNKESAHCILLVAGKDSPRKVGDSYPIYTADLKRLEGELILRNG